MSGAAWALAIAVGIALLFGGYLFYVYWRRGSNQAVGQPCTNTAQCKQGSICVTTQGKGICKAGAGQPCNDSSQCAPGFICSSTTSNGTCVPPHIPPVTEPKPSQPPPQESLTNIHLIDILCFVDKEIRVLSDGKVEVDGKTVKSNVKIQQIVPFRFDLMILGQDGKLYTLPNSKVIVFQGSDWVLSPVKTTLSSITWISSGDEGRILWIQNKDEGSLFNSNMELIERVKSPNRRVYGIDRANYLDINDVTHTIVHYPSKRKVYDALDGVISCNQKVFIATTSKDYTKVRLLGEEPYFF